MLINGHFTGKLLSLAHGRSKLNFMGEPAGVPITGNQLS